MILIPVKKTLVDHTVVELDHQRSHESEAVRALLNQIILEGQTYPQERPLSATEFAAYWMSGDAFVVRQDNTEIIAAFYLKPNFPGRCSHICNAGFIVAAAYRSQGIGRWMGETMLQLARSQGYQAVIFNLVFETNKPSILLWRSLGFSTIGRIPQAVKLNTGHWIDAYIMYRSLLES